MMQKIHHGHQQPVYILAREPRPADRETRFIAPGAGWLVRANHKGDRA
jgi:hypothetical protein